MGDFLVLVPDSIKGSDEQGNLRIGWNVERFIESEGSAFCRNLPKNGSKFLGPSEGETGLIEIQILKVDAW
jgi:hypothetical protein